MDGLSRLGAQYDAILLDLDGSLLDGRGGLGERTQEAVLALREHGIRPLICTGRSAEGARPYHLALGIEDPLIAYNGSWIGYLGARRDDPDVVEQYLTIPEAFVDEVIAFERHARFVFRNSGPRKYTLLSDHPDHLKITAWYERVVALQEPSGLPRDDLLRVTCFFEGPEGIEPAWQAFSDEAREVLHREVFALSLFPPYAHSDLHMCEILAKSRGKAEALDWLQNKEGIPPTRVIAYGDHLNDLSMLEAAGLALCPANAHPRAQALADLVVGHHAEGGLANWIEAGAPLPAPGGEREPVR